MFGFVWICLDLAGSVWMRVDLFGCVFFLQRSVVFMGLGGVGGGLDSVAAPKSVRGN